MTDARFTPIAGDRPIGSEGGRQEGFVQGGAEYNLPHCHGRTKAGIACSAPKCKGTNYCIGHYRSMNG